MNLLSQKQAEELIQKAYKNLQKYNKGSMRLGQTLFNMLPEDIYRHFTGTEYDFYYCQEEQKVLECFYQHYVEE